MVSSSTECSPYTSPFSSTASSPISSRNPSPNRTMNNSNENYYDQSKSLPNRKMRKTSPLSTAGLLLQRADSYRKSSKGPPEKVKTMARLRSKSTPNILYSILNKSHGTIEQLGITEGCVDSNYLSSNDLGKSRKSSCPEHKESSERQSRKSPTLPRKKSLASIFDLKKNKQNSSKIRRSPSHTLNKDDKKSLEKVQVPGPLFQATTMFIPGYDFKTKQVSTIETRRPSTPLFQRRSSKEKIHAVSPEVSPKEKQKEKQRSTPNLTRRGSREKMKLLEDQMARLYQRSDSLPLQLTLSGDECSVCGEELSGSGDDDCEYLSVAERQLVIAQRQRQFAEHQKARSKLEVPDYAIRGKVKKLTTGFEHGKPFWKRYRQKKKQEERLRKHRSCEIEHDSIFRQRAQSYEAGTAFHKRNSYAEHLNGSNSQGEESGYASPVDNNNTDAQHDQESENPKIQSINRSKNYGTDDLTPRKKPKIVLSQFDESLSSSWSHGQFQNKQKSKNLPISPDIARVISTDLCVTEL